jgi:hypothetical protein
LKQQDREDLKNDKKHAKTAEKAAQKQLKEQAKVIGVIRLIRVIPQLKEQTKV